MKRGYVWGVESSPTEGGHHAVVLKTGPERTAAAVGPALAVERAYIAEVNAAFENSFLHAAREVDFDFVNFSSRAFGNIDEEGNGYRLSEVVLKPELVVHYEYELEWAQELLQKALTQCIAREEPLVDIRLEPDVTFEEVLCHA